MLSYKYKQQWGDITRRYIFMVQNTKIILKKHLQKKQIKSIQTEVQINRNFDEFLCLSYLKSSLQGQILKSQEDHQKIIISTQNRLQQLQKHFVLFFQYQDHPRKESILYQSAQYQQKLKPSLQLIRSHQYQMDLDHTPLIAQAATLKGDKLSNFIKTLTSNPALFSYGKFIQQPSLVQLRSTHPQSYDIFQLFKFGDFQTYKQNIQRFPSLSQAQQKKLRQLTVLSQCHKCTQMSMKGLLQKLELGLMEGVKLLIQMIDIGVLKVKISEKQDKIKIFYAISRDIRTNDKEDLMRKLDQIISNNEKAIANVENQIKIMKAK